MDMMGTERTLYEGLDYGPRLGRKIDLGLRDIDPKTLKQALEENRNLGKKAGLGLGVEFSEDANDIEAITLSERAGRELNELVSIVKDEGGQFHFASGQEIDLESLGVYRRKLAVLSKELKRQIEGGGRFGAAEPAVQKAMILLTVIGVLTSACSPALAAEGISTAQPSVTATKEVPATSTTEATIESPIATPTEAATATPGPEVVEVDRPKGEWAEADAYLKELFPGAEVYRSADGYVMVEDKNSSMKLGGIDIETEYGRLTMVWSRARYEELLAVVGKTGEGIGIGDLVDAKLDKGELMKAVNIVFDLSERKPLSTTPSRKRDLVVVFGLPKELGPVQRVMGEDILPGQSRKFATGSSGWISTEKDGVVVAVYGLETDPNAAKYEHPDSEWRKKRKASGFPVRPQEFWVWNALIGFPVRHMITTLLMYGTNSTGYPVPYMTDHDWDDIVKSGLNPLFEGDEHLKALLVGQPAVEVWAEIASRVDPKGKYGGVEKLLDKIRELSRKVESGELISDEEKNLAVSWSNHSFDVDREHIEDVGIDISVVGK